jgi:molecular chaperone DnaK (HSP70)
MRQVQDRVPAEFKVPARSFDPDQAVAKGAAVYALKLVLDREFEKRFGTLDGRAAPEAEKAREQMAVDLGVSPLLVKGYAATQIRNVTSRSFGVAAWRSQPGAPDIQVVNNLVVKQTRIPAECKQVFGTYAANQERADLEFFENLIAGPEATPAQSKKIGEAVLPLPPNLPKGAPIEVTFKINEQGRLVATALDVSTNRAIEVEIDTAAGMSEAEVAQAEERSTRISVS